MNAPLLMQLAEPRAPSVLGFSQLPPARRIRIITTMMRRYSPDTCGDWAADIEQALADMEASK